MDFSFTADQLMLRDNVKTLLARHCTTQALRRAWAEQSGTVPEAWSALAEAGVLSMCAKEDQGGLGLNEVDWILLLEECGYAGIPDPVVETIAVAAPILSAHAQKPSDVLEKISAGTLKVAIKFSDQSLIPHLQSPARLLLLQDGNVTLVTLGDFQSSGELSVDRAFPVAKVPADLTNQAILVQGPGAHSEIMLARLRAQLGVSSFLIGLSRRMLDMTVEYAKTRTQFGVAIGSQQAVKHHLADALIQQEFARPLVYRAAWSVAQRDADAQAHVSIAKILATEAALFVAKQALQVHGAIGYTTEYDLHLFMKRVWALSALYGDVAFHRALVERHVLD